jgi:ferredoxin like protein
MEITDKLAINFFRADTESHIIIEQEKCRSCDLKPCLFVCPGKLYEKNKETGEIKVEFAGCLECGTCLITCERQALKWSYPKGGFGVQYRFG